jgi:lambda family phage portal protein
MANTTLLEQARYLEENHDLVNGILSTLVNNTIGPDGITVEPLPRKADGTVHREFADELIKLYDDWSKRPEVTGQHTRSSMERLLVRSMYRDGEVFVHHVMGRKRGLNHGTLVPYSVELLECDMVPINHPDNVESNVFHGVVKNEWGQPVKYRVYKRHPGSLKAWDIETKMIPADQMLHAKLTNRIGQTRGVSAFAPVMMRLHDLKSYEEAERVAARMAACMGLYIKRGNPDLYTPGESEEEERFFEMAPGIIYDNLLPGEEIGDISPNRPSQLLQPFRDSMLKAASSGVNASYSTVAKDYSGTYSAQRQELSDSYVNYNTLQANFISQVCRPMWEQFLTVGVTTGVIKVPSEVDQDSWMDAQFRGPVQPWIDPAKESSANLIQVRAGFKSISQVIRERGENPRKVFAEIKRERDELEELEIDLSSVSSTDDTNFGENQDDGDSKGKGLRTQGDKDDDKGSDDSKGRAVHLR